MLVTQVKPTVESLLTLLRQLPQLSAPQPADKEELLQTFDIHLQRLNEYIRKLEYKIQTLQRAHDKWENAYNRMTPTQQTQAQPEYEAVTQDPQGLVQALNQAMDKLAEAQTAVAATQNSIEALTDTRASAQENSDASQLGNMIDRITLSKQTINLPKLQLLEFDGNIIEWPRFWTAFARAVDIQPLDNADKLTYLLAILRGKAKELVAGFTVRAENYIPVVKILQETFNQPEVIKSQLRKKLREIPPIRKHTELWPTILTIEQVLQQLEALGETTNQPFTTAIIEDKLPFWLLDEIYKAKNEDPGWDVHALRKFLRNTALRRDQVAKAVATIQTPQRARKPFNKKVGRQEEGQKPTSAFNCSIKDCAAKGSPRGEGANGERKPEGKKPPKNCAFCGGEHYHNQCNKYTSIEQRRERVREAKLCYKCLKTGHMAGECKTNIKPCYFCQKTYHGAICEKRVQTKGKKGIEANAAVTVSEVQEAGRNNLTELVSVAHTVDDKIKNDVLLMCREVQIEMEKTPI